MGGIVAAVPAAQRHWAPLVTAAAWACGEVPRYLYYAFKLQRADGVPYVLRWLRYSLFIVLYPIGIVGASFAACMAQCFDPVSPHNIVIPAQHSLPLPRR